MATVRYHALGAYGKSVYLVYIETKGLNSIGEMSPWQPLLDPDQEKLRKLKLIEKLRDRSQSQKSLLDNFCQILIEKNFSFLFLKTGGQNS